MEQKTIGGIEYRKIDGVWHELGECGYVFNECDSITSRFIDLWLAD